VYVNVVVTGAAVAGVAVAPITSPNTSALRRPVACSAI
jgi:hypothetical protein